MFSISTGLINLYTGACIRALIGSSANHRGEMLPRPVGFHREASLNSAVQFEETFTVQQDRCGSILEELIVCSVKLERKQQ